MKRRAIGLLAAAGLASAAGTLYFLPRVVRTNGVVYGQRNGEALTFDVLRPARPNGLGLLLMVSGGWRSQPAGAVRAWSYAPFLRAGYTVFAVSHVSPPKAVVAETVEDTHRAVRFVRFHAARFGIDPARIGVMGSSAGGHLALLLAVRGAAGRPEAPDPVDRESSAVQAAALFYPISDLAAMGRSEGGGEGPPERHRAAFGLLSPEGWRRVVSELSPVHHVHAKMPPVLIAHGEKDELTPVEMSRRFRDRAREAGAEADLLVRRGAGHGWLSMPVDRWRFARWFDEKLKPRR
jgi:acetyl esterase/lipase